MATSAWTRDGRPVYAGMYSIGDWEVLKQTAQLGEFVMPCCKAPAVLKTSINGLQFFSHLSVECATAPESLWHQAGKVAVLAALNSLGIVGRDEVPGESPRGEKWEADVLFSIGGRSIAIELQCSYQHLRDFIRRHDRYTESGVECYWLARKGVFATLSKSTTRLLLERNFGGRFPPGGIGTGLLPELPVAMLLDDGDRPVCFGLGRVATLSAWLNAIIDGTYQYNGGSWAFD
ncbi:competence protein CoiA [Vogesella sp. XCS3]|uniref:competence protein CoiA n=1 Tax=Vogesella sp. XCS3 TaxID=2877939 RepID=UPI001D0ABCAD|nr:competence protein CoiA family protein [Vogesella sp. XCS3]UDM18946.1 hypothetical protein LCH97_18045 [Vogesella sp. XCS3]